MKTLNGQQESDFVNSLLDKAIPIFRKQLTELAIGETKPETVMSVLESVIRGALGDLGTDEFNAVGFALAYEIGLALNFEVVSGKPCRLTRPRPEMMRTPLNENALSVEDIDHPTERNVSCSLVHLIVHYEKKTMDQKPPEAIGAEILKSYIVSTGIFDNDDFPE